MNRTPTKKDLIVLVADRDMDVAMRAILARDRSLGIRPVHVEVQVHEDRDAGCRAVGVQYLSRHRDSHRHVLLMFDHKGCGREGASAQELQTELEAELRRTWGDRGAVIVLSPELEVWLWSDSPHVDAILGWRGRQPDLRAWLERQGWLKTGQPKPLRPKEALEAALRVAQEPRTPALYGSLARKVSLTRCTDRAFLKLKTVLQTWFPEGH